MITPLKIPVPFYYWSGWLLLCIISAQSCAPRIAQVDNTRTNNLELNDRIAADSSIQSFLAPFKDSLEEEMGENLVRVQQIMTHKAPNSQIGHWMCDLLEKEGDKYFQESSEAAFYNPGGIRIAFIDTGWLKKGRVYELVPFDNYLVQLKMDSALIQKLCDHMAVRDGWPTSEGFTYDIFRDKALNIKIQGQALKAGKTYLITTNDYVANGGDQCDFLLPVERTNASILVRELILEYLREREDPLDYEPRRRVEIMME